MAEEVIICGLVYAPNAEMAACSVCGAVIWPTKGTVKAARQDGAQLICVLCLPKVKQRVYGGYSHHGIRMPDATFEQVLELLERDLRRFRCFRS